MSNGALPSQSMRLVGYFPAGAIHAQNYHVADITAGQLSHVIYAFADVTAAGDCVSINAQDNQGNFSQLVDLKANYPQLLVLISVGGTSHSTNFSVVSATEATRAHFPGADLELVLIHSLLFLPASVTDYCSGKPMHF